MAAGNLTLSDLRTRVLMLVQQPITGGAFYSAANIDSWLNDAHYRLTSHADGIEKPPMDIPTVVGVRAYHLPDSLVKIRWATYDGWPLEDMGLVGQDFWQTGNGTPTVYSRHAGQIILGPNPPANQVTLRLWWLGEPVPMAADGDVPEGVPNRYRPLLADHAAGNWLLADGHDRAAAALLNRFEQGARNYEQEMKYRSRQNFRRVVDVAGYLPTPFEQGQLWR